MKKLWDKGIEVSNHVEKFTIDRDKEYDLDLAVWDILGSIAHSKMLRIVHLLSETEAGSIIDVLKGLYQKADNRQLIIEEGVEDIHSQVEIELTRALGQTGKKIHAGRSRNDQVLLDIRLYTRDKIKKMAIAINRLAILLLDKADKYKTILLPGYSHMQIAMVSSFGLWFGSWAESLIDDLLILESAWKMNNRNPLGTAAGFGTTLPIDRDITTELLCFDGMNLVSPYAQLSRGKVDKTVASALSAIALSIGRLSNDLILYSGQNHSFVELPEILTTGSSIMPQKKNPDALEIIRGKCNRMQALPNEISLLIANLPSGYHRDLQLLKDIVFPSFNEMHSCINMMILLLENLTVNRSILECSMYQPLLSTNEVNRLVMEGKPMREAYQEVFQKSGSLKFEIPLPKEYTHKGSIGNPCLNELRERLNQQILIFNAPSARELLNKLII